MDFQDLILERGNTRVIWEWIGEGNEGDYNEDDPTDVPLLRFSCYKRVKNKGDQFMCFDEWEEMSDASYCTCLPIHTSIGMLAQAAALILQAIQDVNYKRTLEGYSWFSPEDFIKG